MKKFFCLILCLSLPFCMAGCKTTLSESSSESHAENFSEGDATVVSRVNKTNVDQVLHGEFDGKSITVEPPCFTGLPVASVYSYKETYCFMDGTIIFKVAHTDGTRLYHVDKTGKILDWDYQRSGDSVPDDIAALNDLSCPVPGGSMRGEEAVVVQTGEPGEYTQYLCNLQGEKISEGYDSIGYFYNGIALVTKDGKVGLIDDTGRVVLKPCIAYDSVTYPPTERGYSPVFMHEDAFVLPIDGEFAIFTISR